MENDLTERLDALITVMYTNCCNGLNLKKCGNSLLFYLLKSNANVRLETLRKSEKISIDSEDAETLKGHGLIRNGTRLDRFILTARGVWQCDKVIIGGEDALIDIFDSEYFEIHEKHLSDKLKVVLATAIASRTYSNKALISMRVENDLRDRWWTLFQDMSQFLYNNGIIKTDPISNYKSSSSIEDRCSDVIRHTDSIPRATRSIFSKTGKNGYYLDILDKSGVPDIEKLAYVISVVFEDNLTSDNIDTMTRYMTIFSRSKVVGIAGNTFEESYDDASYDWMIRDAFKMALENYEAWKI